MSFTIYPQVNVDYRLSDTYPALLAVPWDVSDELLTACAPHRSRGRVPVLSWLHPESKASLTRASQPQVGVQGRRSAADEELVRQIRAANANANSLLIFDARPHVSQSLIFVSLSIVSPGVSVNSSRSWFNLLNIYIRFHLLTKSSIERVNHSHSSGLRPRKSQGKLNAKSGNAALFMTCFTPPGSTTRRGGRGTGNHDPGVG